MRKGAVDGRYDIQPRRWQSVRRTGGIRWSAGAPGQGVYRKAHVRQRPRLGKAGVTHTGRRTEREGAPHAVPLLLFPCRVHRIITGTRHPYGTRPRRMGAATDGMCRTERQGDGNKKHRAFRALPTAPAIPSGPAAGTSIPSDSSLRHVPDPAYGSVPAISLRWAGAIPPDRIRNPQAGHCKYGPETTAAALFGAAAHLPIPKDYFR